MFEALRILLDADVYHGYHLLENKPPGKFWLNCVEAKWDGKGKVYGREEFDDGLGAYAAVTDMPANFVWDDLMAAYPEAKVVLVIRDFEPWWRSFQATVLDSIYHPLTRIVIQFEPLRGIYPGTVSWKVVLAYFGVSKRSEITKEKAREVFDRHYASIRNACEPTPDRLLEMRIEEGWAPLCKFLNKHVPDVPFPKGNEVEVQRNLAEESWKNNLLDSAVAIAKLSVPVIVAGAAIYCGIRYLR